MSDSLPSSPLLTPVRDYYRDRILKFGSTHQGVDWNNQEGQELRFAVLSRVIRNLDEPFSLDDYGCGYGHLYSFLKERAPAVDYLGLDISTEMVESAIALHGNRFRSGTDSSRTADYAVASGIFNVRLSASREHWLAHIIETLSTLNTRSRHGFSFNCLTSYSDEHLMKDHLFYADPCFFFDHCKKHYSKNVALLHDYGLYEFTILVRK